MHSEYTKQFNWKLRIQTQICKSSFRQDRHKPAKHELINYDIKLCSICTRFPQLRCESGRTHQARIVVTLSYLPGTGNGMDGRSRQNCVVPMMLCHFIFDCRPNDWCPHHSPSITMRHMQRTRRDSFQCSNPYQDDQGPRTNAIGSIDICQQYAINYQICINRCLSSFREDWRTNREDWQTTPSATSIEVETHKNDVLVLTLE